MVFKSIEEMLPRTILEWYPPGRRRRPGNLWIQALERIGEDMTLLNNILGRKVNWISHILRRYCLLHDAIEGQVTQVKGAGRRRIWLLDNLRN
jgi:hypothetical protein